MTVRLAYAITEHVAAELGAGMVMTRAPMQLYGWEEISGFHCLIFEGRCWAKALTSGAFQVFTEDGQVFDGGRSSSLECAQLTCEELLRDCKLGPFGGNHGG
jgi:hypothetical protein